MKTMILVIGMLIMMGLNAAPSPMLEFNFSKDFKTDWEQSASGYYQPLGKVDAVPGGLQLTSNDKTIIIVRSKKIVPARAGDKISITMDVKSEKGFSLYAGVYQFQHGNWCGNEIQCLWVKPGEQSVKVSVVVKDGSHKVNGIAVVFGVSKNESALFKKIKAEFDGIELKSIGKLPLPEGRILHLDGSWKNSMTIADGKVLRWTDLSGNGFDVVPQAPGKAASLAKADFNKQTALRFLGGQEMTTSQSLNSPNGICTFVVFRRPAELDKGDFWQDSLYWGDAKSHDNTGRFHQHMGENRKEEFPSIFSNASSHAALFPMRIGSNAGIRGFLWGDIGEIIVFNRPVLSAAEIGQIREYLIKKWNIQEDDFVRFGPLPNPPKRVTDANPLSDQLNQGKWRKVELFSDEFNAPQLDRAKWTDLTHWTLGPKGVRQLPENLEFRSGAVHLVSKYDETMPSGRLRPHDEEYHSFSAGTLKSINLIRYGYFEARIKMQRNSFNNAFWLIANMVEKSTGREASPEIDIFECAPKSFRNSKSYNMTVHSVQKTPIAKHFSAAKTWKSDFDFSADYHVYGFEWGPKLMRWYIDGVLVRQFKVKENHWNAPMSLHFDTLLDSGWMGVPDPKDFPAAMSIDYCRVWKNAETTVPDDKWNDEFDLRHTIVRNYGFAFDYYKKHGKKIVSIASPQELRPTEKVSLNAVHSPESVSKIRCRNKASVSWNINKTTPKNGTLEITLPHVAALKDNGEVQYVIQPVDWPAVEFPASVLKTLDWTSYKLFALDFINNMGRPEALTVSVLLENNQQHSGIMFLKAGSGTFYWHLPGDVFKNQRVKMIRITPIRSLDHEFKITLTDLRLEK